MFMNTPTNNHEDTSLTSEAAEWARAGLFIGVTGPVVAAIKGAEFAKSAAKAGINVAKNVGAAAAAVAFAPVRMITGPDEVRARDVVVDTAIFVSERFGDALRNITGKEK